MYHIGGLALAFSTAPLRMDSLFPAQFSGARSEVAVAALFGGLDGN